MEIPTYIAPEKHLKGVVFRFNYRDYIVQVVKGLTYPRLLFFDKIGKNMLRFVAPFNVSQRDVEAFITYYRNELRDLESQKHGNIEDIAKGKVEKASKQRSSDRTVPIFEISQKELDELSAKELDLSFCRVFLYTESFVNKIMLITKDSVHATFTLVLIGPVGTTTNDVKAFIRKYRSQIAPKRVRYGRPMEHFYESSPIKEQQRIDLNSMHHINRHSDETETPWEHLTNVEDGVRIHRHGKIKASSGSYGIINSENLRKAIKAKIKDRSRDFDAWREQE